MSASDSFGSAAQAACRVEAARNLSRIAFTSSPPFISGIHMSAITRSNQAGTDPIRPKSNGGPHSPSYFGTRQAVTRLTGVTFGTGAVQRHLSLVTPSPLGGEGVNNGGAIQMTNALSAAEAVPPPQIEDYGAAKKLCFSHRKN